MFIMNILNITVVDCCLTESASSLWKSTNYLIHFDTHMNDCGSNVIVSDTCDTLLWCVHWDTMKTPKQQTADNKIQCVIIHV